MSSDLLRQAGDALRSGSFILIHDSASRENEVDLVCSGAMMTSERVATLRRDAGGLICVALPSSVASRIGLRYLHDWYAASTDPLLRAVAHHVTPYGDRPAFSLSVNHIATRTGITDADRAHTIAALEPFLTMEADRAPTAFSETFRSPGHVQILIGASAGTDERQGHTELALHLAEQTGVPALMVVCEMLDDVSHRARTVRDAQAYADRHGFPFLTSQDIRTYHT